MPDVNRYYAEELGASVEVVIKRGDRGKLEPYILEVQPDCALAITLTAPEGDVKRKPVGVVAQIFGPNGKLIGVLDRNNPIFAHPEPLAESWTIRVTAKGIAPSAELNARVVSRQNAERAEGWKGQFQMRSL